MTFKSRNTITPSISIDPIHDWLNESHAGKCDLKGGICNFDADPFVLSVAQGGVASLDQTATAIAILVAASSNNVLKAVYSIAFAGWRRSMGIVLSLVVLGLAGIGIALTHGG